MIRRVVREVGVLEVRYDGTETKLSADCWAHGETLQVHCGETAANIAAKLGWEDYVFQRVVSFEIPEVPAEPERSEVILLDSRRPRDDG